MAIKLSQNLKQTQNLLMTPQLQQSIKMLTLNFVEMNELISNEIIENPLLEESIENNSEEGKLPPSDKEIFDWQSYFEASGEAKISNLPDREEGEFNYDNLISKSENLAEHLMWQLRMENLSLEEISIAEFIIGNLNDDGYLVTSIEEAAEDLKIPAQKVVLMLEKINRLDPIGCGTPTLSECLLVQAEILGLSSPLLTKIIRGFLNDVKSKNYEYIANSCINSYEEVVEAVHRLNQLYPKPGRLISSSETHYIIPDIFVYNLGENLKIKVNDEGMPKLRISKIYLQLLKSISTKETEKEKLLKKFIKEKLKNAEWFINSVNKRNSTIYLVAEAIVRYQKDFFIKGPGFLKPMTLKVIAGEVGVHESTVSRATSNKYMQTPLGVFELKYFFKTGISSTNGSDISSEVIKTKIKNLIALESKTHPFSDQKIALLLKKDGLNIARRTISKYREELEIPSSNERKLAKEK